MSIQLGQITLGAALIAVLGAHGPRDADASPGPFGDTGARADTYYADFADSGPSEKRPSVWTDPLVYSGIGVAFDIGAGVTGFTDPRVRDLTSTVGGMWSFRAAIGTHIPLGIELGYMGSATAIEGQFGRANATLLGTTLESALRYNLMPRRAWSPYVFAGVGWQRYTIDDRAFQLSDTGIANRDDLLVVPIGTGISYRRGAVVTDLRGTFRAARGQNLVLENPEVSLADGVGSYAPMHQWDASMNVGYEF